MEKRDLIMVKSDFYSIITIVKELPKENEEYITLQAVCMESGNFLVEIIRREDYRRM